MGNGLEVVADGLIYQLQSNGGISRVFSEIFPRMCSIDDTLQITLLTNGQPMQALPRHPRIIYRSIPRIERYLRPGRFFKPVLPFAKRMMQELCIGRGEKKIWHSTYYTMPEAWKGALVITVADMIHERFPRISHGFNYERFKEKRRSCIRRADALICISETTRKDLCHFYGDYSLPIYVVPLACSDVFRRVEPNRISFQVPGEKPFLLYVGDRAAPYKNFEMLLKAYSKWPRHRDIALAVVGSPWSAQEERRLAELGIQDFLYPFTNINDEALCHLYNQAAAFVYPSLYEGFGIPLLEAMACGCPVIASRIPSTIEVAGDYPIYFNASVPGDLLNAFDIVLSEGRNHARLKSGLERVKLYSWDKTAAQTLKVYRALL